MASLSRWKRPRTITFVWPDGKTCSMDEAAASQSKTIMSNAAINEFIIEDPIATGEVMDKVIEYCKKRSEIEQQLEKWDQDFIQGFADDHKSVLAVAAVAKRLEINSLTELGAEHIANAMKKMSIEEMRELFGVVNDFTPEEMEEMEKRKNMVFNNVVCPVD